MFVIASVAKQSLDWDCFVSPRPIGLAVLAMTHQVSQRPDSGRELMRRTGENATLKTDALLGGHP